MKVRLKDIGPAGFRVAEDLGPPFFAAALPDLEFSEPAPEGRVRLELTRTGARVFVRGQVWARFHVACSRCLIAAPVEIRAEVQTTFQPVAAPDPAAGEGWEDDCERYQGDEIDLDPVARDQVLLALPIAPLCRPDCLGLCPECGGDRNAGECACAAAAAGAAHVN